MSEFHSFLRSFLSNWETNLLLKDLILFSIFFLIFSSVYKLFKKFVLRFICNGLEKTFPENKFVTIITQGKFLNYSLIFFYYLTLYSSLNSFSFPGFISKIFFLGVAFSSFMWIRELMSFINQVYTSLEIAQKTPIKGYLQLAKIALYLVLIVITISVFLDKSPKILLGGIGALTAIILLIFRDTLLSFVASIQILSNRLISPKDWISVPSLNVDGEVEEINLHQVIVKNWDKSLSVLPIYQLVNTSFKNWSNMYREGRRIAQSFWLNQEKIIFLSQTKIKTLEKLIKTPIDAIEGKKTNLFYFRQYAFSYLKNHSKIDEKNTLLVRNLQSTIDGIQVQIYAFCRETDWEAYEKIQSEIMEHLTAMATIFDLEIFQRKI